MPSKKSRRTPVTPQTRRVRRLFSFKFRFISLFCVFFWGRVKNSFAFSVQLSYNAYAWTFNRTILVLKPFITYYCFI